MAGAEKNRDRAREQATRHWPRLQSGSWTQAEEASLQKWLAAAPENRAAHEKVARAWAIAGQAGGRVPREMPARRHYGLWIAASLLAILCYPVWLMSDNWWNGTR